MKPYLDPLSKHGLSLMFYFHKHSFSHLETLTRTFTSTLWKKVGVWTTEALPLITLDFIGGKELTDKSQYFLGRFGAGSICSKGFRCLMCVRSWIKWDMKDHFSALPMICVHSDKNDVWVALYFTNWKHSHFCCLGPWACSGNHCFCCVQSRWGTLVVLFGNCCHLQV